MSKKSFKVWVLSVFLGGFVCLGAMTDSIAGVNIDIGTPVSGKGKEARNGQDGSLLRSLPVFDPSRKIILSK